MLPGWAPRDRFVRGVGGCGQVRALWPGSLQLLQVFGMVMLPWIVRRPRKQQKAEAIADAARVDSGSPEQAWRSGALDGTCSRMT